MDDVAGYICQALRTACPARWRSAAAAAPGTRAVPCTLHTFGTRWGKQLQLSSWPRKQPEVCQWNIAGALTPPSLHEETCGTASIALIQAEQADAPRCAGLPCPTLLSGHQREARVKERVMAYRGGAVGWRRAWRVRRALIEPVLIPILPVHQVLQTVLVALTAQRACHRHGASVPSRNGLNYS